MEWGHVGDTLEICGDATGSAVFLNLGGSYIVAEDRASCDDTGSMSSNDIHGSLDVHYDCSNPTDFWAAQSVRIREWEESQRVQ